MCGDAFCRTQRHEEEFKNLRTGAETFVPPRTVGHIRTLDTPPGEEKDIQTCVQRIIYKDTFPLSRPKFMTYVLHGRVMVLIQGQCRTLVCPCSHVDIHLPTCVQKEIIQTAKYTCNVYVCVYPSHV